MSGLAGGSGACSASDCRAGGSSAKTIGLFGGVMLLINNLAGPAISVMPRVAQGAGWLAMVSVMLLLALLSGACALMLLSAMRRVPGNEDYALRVEFHDLLKFYLPPFWYSVTMASYFGYLVLTVMAYIIQTAQVVDYACLGLLGCAYGLEFHPTFAVPACGTNADSSTPFGDIIVLPLSFIVVGLVCVPLAWKNLDDNIVVQWVAIAGLSTLGILWISYLGQQPGFPQTGALPLLTASSGGWSRLVGVLLFNFALMSALPSWVNEKKPEVSVGLTLLLSIGYVVVLYSLIGITGALAYADFHDGNLFSKLNSSGSTLMRATVTVYPILQNLTSIPVFCIFIKYNLVQLGWLDRNVASLGAFAVPWVLSIPFYTGNGFEQLAEWGGFLFSLVINFAVPVSLYVSAINLVERGFVPLPQGDVENESDARLSSDA